MKLAVLWKNVSLKLWASARIFPFQKPGLSKQRFLLLLIGIFLISGCVTAAKDSGIAGKAQVLAEKAKVELQIANEATTKCQQLCQDSRSSLDLEKSPCLSNAIIENWVCDVAHSPRTDADNLQENQCSAYQNQTAEHFIELDINCSLIRLR